MSTSRSVLLRKLRQRGHSVLAAAAERGDISCLAAAQYAGIVRGREPTGDGSPNVANRNAWVIHQLLRGGGEAANPPAEEEAPPRKQAPTLISGGDGSGLPCMLCAHPQAAIARQEISDVWVAAMQGDGPRRPSLIGSLPRACCRRGTVAMTAAALIA